LAPGMGFEPMRPRKATGFHATDSRPAQ